MRLLQLTLASFHQAFAAPAAAQGIPDYIPDTPGESLIDREMERLEERFRGTLSRFYSMGSMDLAPAGGAGFGFQLNMTVGYTLPTGDALFVAVANRSPDLRLGNDPFRPGSESVVSYMGAGYELDGTRLFGDSGLGYRTGLSVALGLLSGDFEAAALDVTPTYDIIQRESLSVPVGVRLSLARIGDRETVINRSFVGLELGVRYLWVNHDRMD